MGLFDKLTSHIGVESEDASEAAEKEAQLDGQAKAAYSWLRKAADIRMSNYFDTADNGPLLEIFEPDICSRLVEAMDEMRRNRRRWLPPETRDASTMEVIELSRRPDGNIESFVIKELFPDDCRVLQYDTAGEVTGQQRGDGKASLIQVTVRYYGASDYRISAIHEIPTDQEV